MYVPAHRDLDRSTPTMQRTAVEASRDADQAVATLKGQTVVIKYGGALMDQPTLKNLFARDVAFMRSAGVNPVVVHGGGPLITRLMERSGKAVRFVDGMRITDDETMPLVETALRQVNREIVDLIERQGASAGGFGGWESSLVRARRRRHVLPSGETVDLGRVGDVESVNPKPIRMLQERGIVPVIAALGIGADALTYDINADLVAGEMAAILGAAFLIFLTDVPGVSTRDGCRYRQLSRWGADSLVWDGEISGGMLPKVEGAVRALKGGAGRAQIIDGRVPHAILRTLHARHGVGTEIVP
ncbi:MAG TPA: acetylglutamate kinase [Candidatus Methylomirabilis sp.]|nr:acetylglutamate kinase [Candidatus Methylomirabilis sp.]